MPCWPADKGKTAEAERYYREVLKSSYAKSEEIQYRIVNFLMHMGRYAEAADRYEAFDNMIAKYRIEPTVDMIYLVKYKFEAYYKAGRKDSALAAAAAALEFADSAIVRQKRSESELRIARDIQMSMVPNTFPEHEGLDLYAQMTPAKEVGGDHLLDVLQHTHFDSARQVVETLYAKVEEHRNGAEANDDLTMLCLRVTA